MDFTGPLQGTFRNVALDHGIFASSLQNQSIMSIDRIKDFQHATFHTQPGIAFSIEHPAVAAGILETDLRPSCHTSAPLKATAAPSVAATDPLAGDLIRPTSASRILAALTRM